MAETIKEKADKIRLEIIACSDSDLVFFAHAVYDGSAKPGNFDSVIEFISDAAENMRKSIPF